MMSGLLLLSTLDQLQNTIGQAGSRVYQKHVRAFMRTLAKLGELWRTLANPNRHIHENLRDIHQSSGEGAPDSPEFRWRRLLYVGWPSEFAQIGDKIITYHFCFGEFFSVILTGNFTA